MAPRIQSPGLRSFLQQELQQDSNATVGSARQHLEELCEAAPGDAVAPEQEWLLELTELLEQEHQHRPLREVLAP